MNDSPLYDSLCPAGVVHEAVEAEQREVAMQQHQTILNFLAEHRGEAFCSHCLAARALGAKRIGSAIIKAEGNGALRLHGECSACGEARLVIMLPHEPAV